MDMALQECDTLKKHNARLISLFLFQYSILIPVMIFVKSTLVVGFFSVFMFFGALLRNRRLYINKKILVFTWTVVMLILIKLIVYQKGAVWALASFIAVACPALYMISLPFDRHEFLETSYKLAIANFFLIFWIPIVSIDRINYMRFGYGMAPTPVFLYCMLYEKKLPFIAQKIVEVLVLFSLFEILVFGSRGSLIPFIIIFAISNLMLNHKNYNRIFTISIVTIVYMNIETVLKYVFEIVSFLGIRSYSLIKIRIQLAKGAAAAGSGRDVLYAEAIDRISTNPIFGSDLTGGLNDTYTHNFFLQIAEEFGIVAVLIFAFFLMYCFDRIRNKEFLFSNRIILAVFISLSMGRLMFSSSYWMRPEFWLFIGFGLIL